MGPSPELWPGSAIARGGGGGSIASGRLAFLVSTEHAGAGSPISPEVKVEAIDTLGNVLGGFGGTVRRWRSPPEPVAEPARTIRQCTLPRPARDLRHTGDQSRRQRLHALRPHQDGERDERHRSTVSGVTAAQRRGRREVASVVLGAAAHRPGGAFLLGADPARSVARAPAVVAQPRRCAAADAHRRARRDASRGRRVTLRCTTEAICRHPTRATGRRGPAAAGQCARRDHEPPRERWRSRRAHLRQRVLHIAPAARRHEIRVSSSALTSRSRTTSPGCTRRVGGR